jgi:tRNA threonylcarbamoyladenosine modification (KEOPS) complex  Pcc1 subunit
MKKAEAIKHLKKLESLAGALGQSSALILTEANRVASELRTLASQNAALSSKLNSYLHWIEIGNSSRKSAKYPGGVSGIESFALADCLAIEVIIDGLNFEE